MLVKRCRTRLSAAGRCFMPVGLVLLLMAGGCSADKADSVPAATADPGQAHGQRGAGGKPQQPPVPVAVRAVVTGAIASYYNATATLEAEKDARLLARVAGVVGTLVVEEGDQVTAGDPLLMIDNDAFRLRLMQAEARTVNLRSRFERLEAMQREELATEEELQAARSELASAEADEGLARLDLAYTTVRAPFTGQVTQRLVNSGQTISIGSELLVMADFHPLLARVHVPSREFNKLQPDQSVDLVLDSNGTRLQGRIKLISPVIDPTSGTIKITVEVQDYPRGTRPGDFAQVRIVTERRQGTILVPRGAVLMDKGQSIAYVVPEGQTPTAERRLVEVGFADDDHTEILDGLLAGEQVVVKGQRSLKPGSPLKVLPGSGGKTGGK